MDGSAWVGLTKEQVHGPERLGGPDEGTSTWTGAPGWARRRSKYMDGSAWVGPTKEQVHGRERLGEPDQRAGIWTACTCKRSEHPTRYKRLAPSRIEAMRSFWSG